jgi:hypothetical protein
LAFSLFDNGFAPFEDAKSSPIPVLGMIADPETLLFSDLKFLLVLF